MTQVVEDPTGSAYVTNYSYDASNNLTSAVQAGSRNRTFTYNSLSQLLTATNPESGAITYTYDVNGNLTSKTSPAPNQTGSANVTLSYCYDVVNNITSKAYTVQSCPAPSPAATYIYGQNSYNGLTIANGIGRRTGMTDVAGLEAWSYDAMGRVVTDKRVTNGISKSASYTYNLDGSVSAINYPLGATIGYQQGGAGRPISSAYTGWFSLAYNVHYAPNGSLCYMNSAWGATFTHIYSFNNRFQPATIQLYNAGHGANSSACSASTDRTDNWVDLAYSYKDPNNNSNNGNVRKITSYSAYAANDVSYDYDSLNRIKTAQTTATFATGPTICYGEQFGYDAWGNLLTIGGSSSNYNGCTQENLSITVNTKNQVSGNTYDAAGNMIVAQPGNGQYVYDAENRLTSAGGQTYLYDGDGKRVEKATNGTPVVPNTLYWYGGGSNLLGESNATGGMVHQHFYFAGRIVARQNSNNWIDHYGLDALGNTRYLYGQNGIWDDSDFYPFGGERKIRVGGSQNNIKFTGKERDSESGLDNFGARYDLSSMGRFMSPDPLLNSGRPNNPQTWNRYAYALNNPLNILDPTGLYDLINTCSLDGNFGTCTTNNEQHAEDLKNGLKNLQNHLKNVKDPVQKARLEKALGAIGTEGDHNGVTVNFGPTKGGGAGETAPFNDPQTYMETYNVTLDPNKISSQNDYAIDAAHEGTHIDDLNTELANPNGTILSPFSLEYRGYQTSAFAASALGLSSISFNYNNKSSVIWNGSWGKVDRNITNFVTSFRDKNGNQDHPETIPHNPWPN